MLVKPLRGNTALLRFVKPASSPRTRMVPAILLAAMTTMLACLLYAYGASLQADCAYSEADFDGVSYLANDRAHADHCQSENLTGKEL